MKRTYIPIVLAAIAGLGSQAFADDMSQHRQMMKECMDQQKAQDSSMSKEQMRKACKEQMKAHQQSSSSSSSTPNQTTPTTTGDPAPQSGSEMNPPTNPPK